MIINDQYKELNLVEGAFRSCKTRHLEVQRVFVQTEANTRGHVFVLMVAYLIVWDRKRAWNKFDLTMKKGLEVLNSLCAMELSIKGGGSCLWVPNPAAQTKKLLNALKIKRPDA